MLCDTDMFMLEELLCKRVCIVTKSVDWLRHVCPSVCARFGVSSIRQISVIHGVGTFMKYPLRKSR